MVSHLVSIVIPVYNRVSIIGETIDSALDQTYNNIEIVIVDNCSTDGTWDLLKQYAKDNSRIRIFRNTENIGPVRNWERGINEARGEYIKILFSDDLISKNFLEETVALFDNSTAFVLSEIVVFNEVMRTNVSKYQIKKVYDTSKYLKDILLVNRFDFPVSPGSALFRTKDLNDALIVNIPNSLDIEFECMGAGNDLLLFLMIVDKYNQIKIANGATAFFRSHNKSFTVAHTLQIHYDFAKYYYMTLRNQSYIPKFKSVLWLKMKKDNEINPVFGIIQNRMDILFIISLILMKLELRLRPIAHFFNL